MSINTPSMSRRRPVRNSPDRHCAGRSSRRPECSVHSVGRRGVVGAHRRQPPGCVESSSRACRVHCGRWLGHDRSGWSRNHGFPFPELSPPHLTSRRDDLGDVVPPRRSLLPVELQGAMRGSAAVVTGTEHKANIGASLSSAGRRGTVQPIRQPWLRAWLTGSVALPIRASNRVAPFPIPFRRVA
jgi:hypothetical protein